MVSKKKVSYFYDEDIGNFYYGMHHPMKPHRIRMAHKLIVAYGTYKKMKVYKPFPLSAEQMTVFHADDYINFLKTIHPNNEHNFPREVERFNVDMDCPVFDGLWKFNQLSAGGSVGGAYHLNTQSADIVVNWAGGLHHAKKSEASGFCYINDIVLAILELLKKHQRVLYIDIDIHHGDGVEEAFYTTDRVMTVSFHKYGDFFPGTGSMQDIGVRDGRLYSINFPLEDGMDDDSFLYIFKPLIRRVVDYYQPEAIVLQCGADSLTGDRLGCFNLTLKGHGECVNFVKSFGLPLLVLGGGGYTIRNVARCWAHETAICVGEELAEEIPYNEYMVYYEPNKKLQITPSNAINKNTKYALQKKLNHLMELLQNLPHAPSVQMQEAQPLRGAPPEITTEKDPDVRVTKQEMDEKVETRQEFYDGDNDQDETVKIKSHYMYHGLENQV